jgi:hypothetical protein
MAAGGGAAGSDVYYSTDIETQLDAAAAENESLVRCGISAPPAS